MNRAKTVDEYILKSPEWQEELMLFRSLLLETELEEGVKWGAPIYMIGGKNVIGLASFKNWVTLWFHQGVFLEDAAKVLYNAQEGKTKGLRQWRFEKGADIPMDLVRVYIAEAIENQKTGKEIKASRKPPTQIAMPSELASAFQQDVPLENAFFNLKQREQREYKEYIGSAKQEATRLRRLQKCKPMIMKGIGLNDKYRT